MTMKNLIPLASIKTCPANERAEQSAVQISLQKTNDGFTILSGQRRLEAALTIWDEVKVNAGEIGEVMIAKLPDGKLVVIQDRNTMALFGL